MDDSCSPDELSSTLECLTTSDYSESMQEVDFLSPIELLPREIVFKIVEYALESVFELREASRMLQSRVDEFTLMRVTIPLVEEIKLVPDPIRPMLRLEIVVPKSKSNLFELRWKLSNPPIDLKKRIKRENAPLVDKPNCYKVPLKFDATSECTWLLKCIGKHTGIVSLRKCSDPEHLAAVSKVLCEMQFSKLKVEIINISIDVRNHLLETIKAHQVDYLSLDVKQVCAPDPVNLLLDLSSHIRSLHIYHPPISGLNPHSRYLFGIHNADWAPIIIDMFAKRLDKLLIDNRFYPMYLSGNESSDKLVAKLPLLGKAIWFEATCSAFFHDHNQEINDHSIQAEGISGRDRGTTLLKIKHNMRVNEQFLD